MATLASPARSAGAMSQLTRVPGGTWVPLPSNPAGRKLAGKKAEKGKPQGPGEEPLALTRS
eukprot:5945210-Amphidinium_carterae.2